MSNLATTEDKLSSEIEEFFRDLLDASEFADLVEVPAKRQVVTGLTIGRDGKNREWRYFIGLQQQDIVFYLKDEQEALTVLPSPALYHWLSKTDRDSQTIRIPLLIFELKLNRNFTSDQFITYSRIASQIKEVHPHCAYYFIVGGAGDQRPMPETVLRQAKSFDRVYLKWEQQKATVWDDVRSHLAYLRDRARVIPR